MKQLQGDLTVGLKFFETGACHQNITSRLKTGTCCVILPSDAPRGGEMSGALRQLEHLKHTTGGCVSLTSEYCMAWLPNTRETPFETPLWHTCSNCSTHVTKTSLHDFLAGFDTKSRYIIEAALLLAPSTATGLTASVWTSHAATKVSHRCSSTH